MQFNLICIIVFKTTRLIKGIKTRTTKGLKNIFWCAEIIHMNKKKAARVCTYVTPNICIYDDVHVWNSVILTKPLAELHKMLTLNNRSLA